MTRGVLILTPYFFPVIGGVESNAERLARYLVGERERVQVLTKRVGRDLPDVEDRDGILVRRIGPHGERSSFGKWQMMPAALVWLIRHASDYDVVCCVDYRAIGVAALLARVITGRPVVCQAQTTGVLSGDNADRLLAKIGVAPTGRLARMLKWPVRALYGRADTIACISHEIEREALACGVPAGRVSYFPNAIDMTHFRPADPGEREQLRRQWDLPADRVICVFVGRLSREKGLLDLLEAWRLLASADPPERTWGPASAGPPKRTWGPALAGPPLLLIAGPDMTGHAWDVGVSGRAFVEQHALGTSVRFVGPVADVASLVRASDLVVQPSHFEALGLSAIEALASGVPVVASSVGGLLEFIVDGENGRLCPPHDPERLAASVGALLSDEAARARLASRARESVRHEYDERLVFGRMRDLFERLVGG
jgi:D-inositol-3-phosphate glycosyltransferase